MKRGIETEGISKTPCFSKVKLLMVYRRKRRGKETYLLLPVLITIFASNYGGSSQSRISPDCDLKYRLFEGSQDTNISGLEILQLCILSG